jgi:hypothetical protein
MVHKYRAVATEYNGRKFPSKAEAKRAWELEQRQKNGEIEDLEYQPEFELLPSFVYLGNKVRPLIYRADFKYRELQAKQKVIVVEDVKGFATAVFLLKQKLFWHKYPDIELRVIR